MKGRVAVASGRIVNFNAVRGFGFIAPDNGGVDVFVHADELVEAGIAARTGARVDFEVVDGQRGPKAFKVRPPGPRPPGSVNGSTRDDADLADNDFCDAVPSTVYASEITNVLISIAPTMTAAQIVEVRDRMVTRARARGWLLD